MKSAIFVATAAPLARLSPLRLSANVYHQEPENENTTNGEKQKSTEVKFRSL